MFLLILAACSGAPSSTGGGTTASTAASAEAHEHEHGDDPHDHGHGAKHGGIQKELDGMHLEGLVTPDGVMFWPSDADARPLPVESISGTAMINSVSGIQQASLMAMGDHLHAAAKLTQGQPATVRVTLTREGKGQSVTFEVPAVGMALHDHSALHGGQVSMWGDHHVEYVGKDGEYRFWVTDAARQVVKESLTGTVKDGAATVPLTLDATTGLLSGKGDGAGTRPVTVDVTAGTTSFSLTFNPTPVGEMNEHIH